MKEIVPDPEPYMAFCNGCFVQDDAWLEYGKSPQRSLYSDNVKSEEKKGFRIWVKRKKKLCIEVGPDPFHARPYCKDCLWAFADEIAKMERQK